MRQTAVVSSPVGRIAIEADGEAVTAVHLDAPGPLAPPRDPILRLAAAEIEAYFLGRLHTFSVPLRRPSATPFQHRLWDALERIPFGETRTYGQLAEELGTSPRAVGGACARNALPLFIPCHRVVGRQGLGGFSGDWETGLALSVKRRLLDHEAAHRSTRGPRT